MRTPTIDEITKTATRPGAWSGRDVVLFHYVNPNGLCERRRKVSARLRELVNARRPKGSPELPPVVDFCAYDKIVRLVTLRRVRAKALEEAIKALEFDLASDERIAERLESGQDLILTC